MPKNVVWLIPFLSANGRTRKIPPINTCPLVPYNFVKADSRTDFFYCPVVYALPAHMLAHSLLGYRHIRWVVILGYLEDYCKGEE